MKSIKFLFSTLILSFVAMNSWAQSGLTEGQKEQFRNRVKQKVEEFQDMLEKIVDNELRSDIRKESVTNALKLFIGEGDPYDYVDESIDQRIHSDGVKMQTSSVNRSTTRTQKLKRYLYKLYNPQTGRSSMSYSKIVIESASAVRVDNIQRVGDHYECVAYFSQKFFGYRDGRIVYGDLTGKKIRCYITSIDLPTGQQIFEAKLGDIYVTSTERVYQ